MKQKHEYSRDSRSPVPKNENISHMMHCVKGSGTSLEKLFRSAVFKEGIKGYRVNYSKLPGKPDICFIKKKIAVFINGCFWHRCPVCKPHTPAHNNKYWDAKFSKTEIRDKQKSEELIAMGWTVFVFWECEINNNISEQVLKLKSALLA